MRLLTVMAACKNITLDLTGNASHATVNLDALPNELGIGGGAWLRIEIDIDSGRVISWKTPDPDVIREIFTPELAKLPSDTPVFDEDDPVEDDQPPHTD